MKNKRKPTQTPQLRFPEFRNEPGWVSKVLGEEGEFVPSLMGKTAEHFGVGSAKYITYKNVFSNVFTDVTLLNSVDVSNDESQNVVVSGDVLFTVSSETPNEAGMSSVMLDDVQNCYLNSFCTIFRFDADKRPNNRFVGYLMRSPLVRNHFAKYAQGSTRFNLSRTAFKNLRFAIPTAAEQRKIAECLTTLDELIAAHGQKLEALRAHKRGLMQQLFPREGEEAPTLRFPEFRKSQKWRKRRISDLLTKVSSQIEVQAAESYREIGVRSHGKGIFHKDLVSGSTIGEKRVFRVVEDALVVNIVFAWEQAVATTSRNEEGMIASHRFPMYLPRSGDSDVRFIKFTFLTPMGKHLLGVASPGGAGRNRTLGQAEFEMLEIIVPGKEEQTKIADAIDAIDVLIAPQAEKFDLLQVHKWGLMQQIFPASWGD